MPERMNRELFLNPAFQARRFKSRLHPTGIHWRCSYIADELVSYRTRKQQARVPMSGPKASHCLVCYFRKWYIAIPATFAISNMYAFLLSINVSHFQREPFTDS